jgi:outer membrane lipopolysaccharide assembly protein LptE/RlpB
MLVQTARMKKPFLMPVLLLTLALSACGFHLRGALELPEDLGRVRFPSPRA